uniref:Coiled-coil domain containing 141 n=1 Tax=Cyprinus carpio TaxID=7962 RepID=A0A8C1S579_CYPCA
MSSEGDAGGQPSTTTISTVAVQAGDSQIVVAVLKVIEFELCCFTVQRCSLNRKNEGGVWALLEEADKTAAQKEGEELVYKAMAVSLSEAWKTLVAHLEKRRSLLILACHFFECALEFAIRIDEAEDFQSVEACALSSGMLEKSMLVLNKSRELLEFLKDFQSLQALQYGRASHGAWSSFGKVEGLMEILQDRRRQVDLCMRQQQHELEMIYRIRQWERQEQEVTQWFKEKATLFLENSQLGSSLSENEELLREYKEYEQKAKMKIKLAFEVLSTVEIAIKELKNHPLPLPELARKHEEFSRSIKDTSAEPLQRGQLIIQKLDPQSAQGGGLQRMLGYIKERMEVLSHECHAHRELTGKRQQLVSSFEELVDKVSAWIKSSNSVLSSSTEPGSSLTEAEDTLNKHVELLSQSQTKTSIPIMTFCVVAQVEEKIRILQECYKNRPEEEEEYEGAGASMKDMLDAKWQSLLQKFFAMQDLGNNFINSSNMISGNLNLNIKAAGHVVEKYMETLTKKKSELADLWTTWQLHYSQMKSVKKQWKKFKDQLKKVLHDLKAMEEIFAPASKVDLGGDSQSVSKLQDNFNAVKPGFLQLNAEVEFLVKTSELLGLKGIPVKEKNERVSELLQLHQRVRDKIREYETILIMASKFHQLYQELDTVLHAEPVTVYSDTSQARTQLTQHQERQRHIHYLYKLALSLGADLTSTVQQSRLLVLSVQQLKEKLEKLERGSVEWIAEANKCEESLMSIVHFCLYKEEIGEVSVCQSGFELIINFLKKHCAMEKQCRCVLKKKLQAFTLKESSSSERHLIGNSLREIEDALNELQRQVGDFDRTVEEYKQNLDMNVKLQQALEEYQFWCDEASSTIVRVGKYSSQCKTKEAVSSLYKQFEKFVWPTIPQQEERISQITELAVRLHGAEEGKKYMEKSINKHHEIVESIKELSNGLLDLEAKLQLRKTLCQDLPDKHHPEQQKVLSETRLYTQEAFFKTSKVETITSKSTIERREEMHTSFSHSHNINVSHCPAEWDKSHILQQTKRDSQETPPPLPQLPRDQGVSHPSIIRELQCTSAHHSLEEEYLQHGTQEPAAPVPEDDFQPDHLTEESLSNDEYECTSPDDISLPPLSETPESNIIQSENDLDDGYCMSSHSLHINQHSHQSHSQHGDTLHQRQREWMSSQAESYPSPTTGLGARFRAESSSFVQSPLTVPAPSLVSNTISSILKSKSGNPPSSGITETHYSVHESCTEMQKCVHDSSTSQCHSGQPNNTHATPTPLTTEQDSDLCKPTAIREEIRRASSKKVMGKLAGGTGPNFSKPLSNATVMEGSPVTLEVEVTEFPEPTLTWFKNGHKLANDEHIELSHKEGKHTLFIHSSAVRDSGQYVVTASNSAGTVTSSSMLQVKGNNSPDLDILKLDWHTCFGTLCFFLWLLYLLLL